MFKAFAKQRQRVSHNAVSLLCIYVLSILLSGCSVPGFNVSDVKWKTYSNSRYDFEFPYPSNWTALPSPANNDGITLVSPQNNTVEIRAWASHRQADFFTEEQDAEIKSQPNFLTTQGVSGVMLVEVGEQISSMTLTITQGQVKYYWQGRTQSQEFQNYYALFYYIAQQYRISQ